MDCPRCGFAMTELETECPRCLRYGPPQEAKPPAEPPRPNWESAAPRSYPAVADPEPAPSSEQSGPMLVEPNRFANSIRGWGSGLFALSLIGGILMLVGGLFLLANEEVEQGTPALIAGVSFLIYGFWFRDLHRGMADGLDALADIQRRVRRRTHL